MTVIQAGQGIQGQFGSISASSSDPCLVATAQPVYTASTVSALLSVSSQCSSSPTGPALSSGAIAGIAVGSVVGGIVLALVVFCVTRNLLRERQKRMLAKLRASEITSVQSELDKVALKQEESDAALYNLDDEVKTLSTNHMHQMIEEKVIVFFPPPPPVLYLSTTENCCYFETIVIKSECFIFEN